MSAEVKLEGTEDQIAKWIWINLVPKSGQSAWLQGELLRAIEKLRWEAQSNGNINWDDRFEMLLDLLSVHLLNEPQFSSEAKAAIRADLNRLKNFRPVNGLVDDRQAGELPYVADDLYDRLISQVVKFCRLRPQLIQYQPNPSQYR